MSALIPDNNSETSLERELKIQTELREAMAFQPTEVRYENQEYVDTQDALALFRLNQAATNARLEATGDLIQLDTSLADFRKMIDELGFSQVFQHDFQFDRYPDEVRNESLFLHFNKEHGILLKYLSSDDRPDSIRLHFSWRPSPLVHNWHKHLAFSHSKSKSDDTVLLADFQINEGLKAKLRTLYTYGEFIKPWPGMPPMYLLDYSEMRNLPYDGSSKRVTFDRLNQIQDPEVRQIIGLSSTDVKAD